MPDYKQTIEGLEALHKQMSIYQCYACNLSFLEEVQKFYDNILDDAIELLKTDMKRREKM